MGNTSSNRILHEDLLATYIDLSYLRKSEILYIVQRLDDIDPGKLNKNLQHRFPVEQIETILPHVQCSPFSDSIYRVFSSKKDNHLSLEDVLDLCSAFSDNAPDDVRAAWAFYIFDLDGDNQISLNDLMGAVERLTGNDQDGHQGFDTQQTEHVARMVLQEMIFNQMGSISQEEFIRFVLRIPEFFSSFRFRI
ncbi:PREDICTED: calcium and integrin-binding protein 1-like [Dufourea novaeangliae]|uniref:calcium and integrin-binding protein 1-like n=1 Tax=Dufourea novaeangliae TaxID=178035 RepID=UPI00076701D5|nr:PREDICTED: calcium and integrin-binding protein 1-like [Dufourea novaeangliae]